VFTLCSDSFDSVLTIGAEIATALDCILDIIPKLEDVSVILYLYIPCSKGLTLTKN
jgi:hypothetical protein